MINTNENFKLLKEPSSDTSLPNNFKDYSANFQPDSPEASPMRKAVILALLICILIAGGTIVIKCRQIMEPFQERSHQLLREMKCLFQSCEINHRQACSNLSNTLSKFPTFAITDNRKPCKNITEALYNEATTAERIKFHQKRVSFVNSIKNIPGVFLSKYNLETTAINQTQKKIDLEQDYLRVHEKYHLQEIKGQLPFCISVPTRNNNENFRVESNLDSILRQNYTNYRVVIVDDASTDGTADIIQKYLDFHGVRKPFVTFVKNKQRLTTLMNHHEVFHFHCHEEDIGVTIDGDDEMVGRNVLKIFNAVYQRQRAGFVYSNYFFFSQTAEKIVKGYNGQYTQEEKKKSVYRDQVAKYSQIRTFQVSLFRSILRQDLQNKQGEFYRVTSDMALSLPILQMSCGRVSFVDQQQLLYNSWLSSNDNEVNLKLQFDTGVQIKQKPKYSCSEKFLALVSDDKHWIGQ